MCRKIVQFYVNHIEEQRICVDELIGQKQGGDFSGRYFQIFPSNPVVW